MRRHLLTTTAVALLALAGAAHAGMNEAKQFLDKEIGDLSTLSRADQEKELQWFVDAAKPFQGMEIKVVSETLTTHQYESQVLAPAFTAITGIKVTHDVIQEGDVVEKIQTQMQTGQNLYDGWVNDSDLIGTHWRYKQVRNLTDWMAGEGKDVTNPGIDIADYIGSSFTTAPDKKLYQLPDQQFANLYWFRYDWFNDEKNKADFKAKYGYDLGVPVNWSAYEDIAEFFTGRDVNGKKVYGHMDYGKKDPSLGWRFTDAWLSMAGNGDKGLPNGLPVDEWGIKVDANSRPVGSCAVSYTHLQREYIVNIARKRGLTNLTVVTADMNDFATDERHDRVVSVEMFEHMSNWRTLLERVRGWLKPDGRLFLHIFTHRYRSYRFDHDDPADWIAHHFFTGGIMPAHDLPCRFGDLFTLERKWRWSGIHYRRTALDWLANFDREIGNIQPIFAEVYGKDSALWQRRWRLFFLATAGLFGHDNGDVWGVGHYLLKPAG